MWSRIVGLEGETFSQKRGKQFTYLVMSGAVYPDTTDHVPVKSQFARALDRLPLAGPGEINDVRGPSYIYAILSDARVLPD